MRKKNVIILFFSLMLGCNSNQHPNVSNVKTTTRFKRFEVAFYSTDSAKAKFYPQLNTLKKDFPYFFMSNETDRFFYLQRKAELPLKLYAAVNKNLGEFENYNEALSEAFKHFYHYFGDSKTYQPFTYISNLDFEYPVILADSVLFVASDMYLGVNSPFYQSIPNYQAYYRQPAFLVRDVMEAMALAQVKASDKDRLLDNMIFNGKLLYFIYSMMPDAAPSVITRYTEKDLLFAKENEKSIWAYFIENNLLFDTSIETKRRFIELAPFSKFYTKLDNESPGMIGKWVGYQIVKEYMKNTGSILQELLLEVNNDKILRGSGYKP